MKTSNKKRILTRYGFVVLCLIGFSAVILASLFRTTVVHAKEWNIKADSVWMDTATIQPERGKILADDGTVLSANLYYYITRIDWTNNAIKDKDFENDIRALCDSLHAFDDSKTAKEYEDFLRKGKKEKKSAFRLFKQMLTHSEFERVSKFPFFNRRKNILYGERLMRRKKPFGNMAARSIGNVGDPQVEYYAIINWQSNMFSEKTFRNALPALCDSLHAYSSKTTVEEWRKLLEDGYAAHSTNFRLLKKPVNETKLARLKKFPFLKIGEDVFHGVKLNPREQGRHGTSGLESALDSLLYGIPGHAPKVALNTKPVNWGGQATPGYDVTTTINIQLQDIVEQQLHEMLNGSGAKWGTAILMETATGEIKAISNLDWNEEAQDYLEGQNHAVQQYEPGSVMKPISMLVALEDGIVHDIRAKVETGSVFNFNGGFVKEDHGGAAALSPVEIIAHSSNVGMARLIYSKYGSNPDGFRQRLEQLGFFDDYNTGIAGECVPYFPKISNDASGRIDLTREAFGYRTLIPPLHTLAFFNAMANDGKYVCPRLVKKLSREGEPDSIVPVKYVRQQLCSPENAAKMREMLHGVVWEQGTGRCLQDSVVHIAGKTGTAFITSGGGYSAAKRYAFCGFFPYEKPKYSCMVLIWGGPGGAAATSGNVLKNIALKMYARGLLDNQSDYVAGNGDGTKRPTISATCNISRNNNVKKSLGLGATTNYKAPEKGKSGSVPNVKGLNVREAIARLEKLGINVKCEGSGIVTSQSLAPGSPAHRGLSIKLTLNNRTQQAPS